MEEIRFCPSHGFYRGDKCDCGVQGEVVISEDRATRLGKFISGALRHFPDRLKLEMDEHGWVEFDDLVRAVIRKYKWASKWHVLALIKSDVKGRYELSNNKIRARYGHSIDVNLDFPECDQETLYYGTSEEEADRLLEIGIKPVRQRYVHLSTTIEKSTEVARLRTERPIILEVDAKKAREDGIKIIQATKDICLSDEIPPEYIKKVIRI